MTYRKLFEFFIFFSSSRLTCLFSFAVIANIKFEAKSIPDLDIRYTKVEIKLYAYLYLETYIFFYLEALLLSRFQNISAELRRFHHTPHPHKLGEVFELE